MIGKGSSLHALTSIFLSFLPQQLQSSGPLKYKLSSSLLKLQQEAEFILDLLNIAVEPDTPPQIEHSMFHHPLVILMHSLPSFVLHYFSST